MKRLGPDLKMPDLRAPDFLVDLFYDLRDRRLLAPIALALVAIAAVPILLGGGSKEPSAAPSAGAGTAPAEPQTGRAATLTVVEAKPGLRDYRKRLAAEQPTDPFRQHYTRPRLNGSELGSQTESSTSSSTTVTTSGSSEATTVSTDTTTTSEPPSYTPPPGKPLPGAGDKNPQLTFFTWAIDVWISRSGGKDAGPGETPESGIKREVLPQTSIPGPKAPVVTYMGLSRQAAQKHHAKRALLLVSDEVGSVSSEARCVSGEEVCQLVEVEPGRPVTFVYGASERRYTIKLLKAELLVTGHS